MQDLRKHTAWSRQIQLTDLWAFALGGTQKRKASIRSDSKIRVFWSQITLNAAFRKSVWWKRLSRAVPVAQWNATRPTKAKNVQKIYTCDDGVGALKPLLPRLELLTALDRLCSMPVALAKRKARQIHDSGKIDLCPTVSCTNPTFIQSTGSDTTPQTTQTYAQLLGHRGS